MDTVYTYLSYGKVSALLINVRIVVQQELLRNVGGARDRIADIAGNNDMVVNAVLADDTKTKVLCR